MEACVICSVAQFRGDTKYLPMGFVGSLFMEACVIRSIAQFRGDTKYLPMGFVWKLYMEACSICVLHRQVCNLSIHAQHLSSLKIALVGFIFPSRV
jgi:hypothetical protein